MKARAYFLAACLPVLAVAAACSSHKEGLDPSVVPNELKSDYQLFTQRCSKCHSLARPLTAGIRDDDQWVNYVNRMRRQPGSGISHNDQAHILRFLKWHAADLRRHDAEKMAEQNRSAPPPPAPIPPPVSSFVPEPADGGP